MKISRNKMKIVLAIYVITVVVITQFPIIPVINIHFSFINCNLIPFQFLPASIDRMNYFLSAEYHYSIKVIASTLMDIYKNFLCNMILFFPLGFLLPILYDKFHSLKRIILISFLSSVCIETLQLVIMITTITPWRAFDIDDIIANTLGGAMGFGFYIMTIRFTGHWLRGFVQFPGLVKKNEVKET
ncbi:MAG: hypothetical protein APF84_09125 [Gracilibacter sp. BRH_c7a]|nr:MAG: hypothetical protein APF84_09125 [Gracilibacter sp. BRH_c7a]